MNIENRDILTVSSGFICQQVNCEKVMGAGLAAQIKKKWPIVYTTYLSNKPVLGEYDLVRVSGTMPGLYVANLYGQQGFGTDKRQTNYGALSSALASMAHDLRFDIPHIYFPFEMGCGLGGGDWNIVSELIEFYFPNAIICRKE